MVNRIIEIELPRYAVTPWDRFQQRSDYWKLSEHPSPLPGGTWTIFNWKANTIGIKTQRIEYADQLRQPQVEIAFDELICYLLDLGAVPDTQGWRILRSTGQWTPVGCALMRSPNGEHKALTIASADDSDGLLSLAVEWRSEWICRDSSSLPPYWVRLYPSLPSSFEESDRNAASSSAVDKPAQDGNTDNPFEEDLEKGDKPVTPKLSVDSVTKTAKSNADAPITCQISTEGLVSAHVEEVGPKQATHINSLYIEHLRLGRLPSYASATGGSLGRYSSAKMAGVWFASAITAYGTGDQTVLWNYKIPDFIIQFSRKDTIPCGLLVELNIVAMSETPEWATIYDDQREEVDRLFRRNRDLQRAMQEEMKMPMAQRTEAQRKRLMREAEDRLDDVKERMRRKEKRAETRMLEAIQSPRWENQRVAEYALSFLKKRDEVAKDLTNKEAVGTLLHRMILDGEFCSKLVSMLDMWRSWSDNGGMRRADYTEVQKMPNIFAMAVSLVSLISSETTGKIEGTLAMDLQESLALWKKVRLG